MTPEQRKAALERLGPFCPRDASDRQLERWVAIVDSGYAEFKVILPYERGCDVFDDMDEDEAVDAILCRPPVPLRDPLSELMSELSSTLYATLATAMEQARADAEPILYARIRQLEAEVRHARRAASAANPDYIPLRTATPEGVCCFAGSPPKGDV